MFKHLSALNVHDVPTVSLSETNVSAMWPY